VGRSGLADRVSSDFQATIAKGKETSHVLHLLLTIFTVGLWLIPWLVLGVAGGVKRKMITIDEYATWSFKTCSGSTSQAPERVALERP
jgi:hypothetical protein